MSIKSSSSSIVAVLLASVLFSGCSVNKAASGPEKKDLSVLETGTSRYQVLAELGQPVVSEKNDKGLKVDVFKFVQGQSKVAQSAKAVTYGVFAVGTLGLSELVTTPLEGTLGQGAEVQVVVTYDESDQVLSVESLKDERLIGKPIE